MRRTIGIAIMFLPASTMLTLGVIYLGPPFWLGAASALAVMGIVAFGAWLASS